MNMEKVKKSNDQAFTQEAKLSNNDDLILKMLSHS